MAALVLVHGSTHSARAWDLVRAELEHGRHAVITPELPADEPDASATRYSEVIAGSIPEREYPIVVAHSDGGWFLPLVAGRLRVRRMASMATEKMRLHCRGSPQSSS